MNLFSFFFVSYILTYSGFLLGKATKEEHKEIKNYVKFSIIILTLIYYGILLFLFWNSFYFIISILLLLIYLISENNIKIINSLHNTLLYGISFLSLYYLHFEKLFVILILLTIMILKNSFNKFHLKDEIYKIIILIITYLLIGFFY